MKSKKIKKISASGKRLPLRAGTKKQKDDTVIDNLQATLLDHMREFAIVLKPDGRVKYVNLAFANLLRLKPGNIVNRMITEFESMFHTTVPFTRIIGETMSKGRWTGITETRLPDGKIFYYSLRTRAVTDKKGNISCLIGIGSDVSSRVRSDESLRECEHQRQQWFEHSPDGIFVIRGKRFEYVNPSFSRMTGYTVDQLTHEEFDCFTTLPESAIKSAIDFAETGQPQTIVPLESPVRIRQKSGTFIDAEITAVLIGSTDKIAVFGTARDITEQLRTASALKEAEQWFSTVFESNSVGMAVSDPAGYLIRTNEAFQRMVGYTGKELQLIRASDITHPEDFESEVRKIRELASDPGIGFFRTDKRYIRKDGRIIWARLNTIAVRNENNALENYFGIIEDITERKYAETLIRLQHDLSVNLSSATDIDAAMNYVLSESLKIEEFSAGCVYLSDRWKNIRFLAHTNLSSVMTQRLPSLPQDKLRHAFFSALQVNYLRYHDFIHLLDVGYDEDLKHEDYQFVTVLPVIHDDEIISALVLFSQAYDRISRESREVLESVMAQLGGIIARLRTVDALVGSEERYRRLLDSATDYVVSVVVTQGQPVKSYHGERCITVTGYSPEDFNRDPYLWFNMVHHDDQYKVSELVRRVLSEESVTPLEHRIYHKDGSIRWIRHTVVRRYNPHGELTGYDALISDITQRKEAEILLIEQEEYYRAIFEGAQIGIFLETFDGKIINANPSACQMLGYSLDELKEISVDKIVPPEYFNSVEVLRTLDNDIPVIIAENIRKDGSRIWVEVIRRIININRQIVALVFVQDITQRKRNEAELLLHNTRFQQLFSNSPLGMIMVDSQDRILMVNQAFTGIFQYEQSETINRKINQLIVPEHLFTEASSISEKTLHGESVEYETVRRRKNGSLVDVHIWGVPILFNGNQIGVFGIYADISERKKAEKQLFESEEKYRSLFEDSKDAVYISTPEGYFVNINSAGVQLFGYDSPEELSAVHIPTAIYEHTEDRKRFERIMENQGYIRDFEVTLKQKRGEKIDAIITSTAVRDDNGRIIAYRGIIRDNTSYKQLQRQLIQAQKMESIGTLSGGIAHDFNNVLAVVLSTAELIRKRTAGNEDLAELTEMIINSAMRGRFITQQLLLFSRSDNPILRPVSLSDIITENVKLLEHSLPKSITVQLHSQTTSDTVLADISHLHQIVLNLAINARDAMPNGGTLTIVVDRVTSRDIQNKWPEADDIDYIALFISDTGTGIPPELHTRIFDPFFTTKEQGKGTGLGLSIVHGIVKNHRGFIELDSQAGVGATFRIYFPSYDKGKIVEESLDKEINAYSGTETILIVDDEPTLIQLLSDILSMSGYEAVTAQNGVDALKIYLENPDSIRLVISDIGMPEMDGIQLFQHLRDVRPDLPVILATGYMGESTSTNLLKEGIADIIFKPYSVADILKTIRQVLDKKSE